jgi:hypothetical protein
MKKIFIIAAASFLFASSSFAAEPNQKVLSAFNKTFNQVKDVIWQDVEENRYEANFNQNNITYRVMYDQEGNVVKSIRYYFAQTLPIFIQAKLAKKYDGKKVFGVTEVTTETEIQYHIILEDASNWTHVQSDSFGNMFTEKKLKKA